MRAMKCPIDRPFGAILLCCCLALAALPPTARADDAAGLLGPGHWRLTVSPLSYHFHYSADHRYVWAIGAERQRDDDWLAGAAFFSNSFGQPSGYLYVGKRWPGLLGEPQLFGQASGGLLYGYRGRFKNKVPFNVNGYSPGALVSLGWQFNAKTSACLHLLGDAGLMVQLGYEWR
jgi:hypothetical protein